jgi:competence protein ComFC
MNESIPPGGRFLPINYARRIEKIGSKIIAWLIPEVVLPPLPAPTPHFIGNKHYIIALYEYRHPAVKRTIWALKYRKNKRALKRVTAALYDVLIAEASEHALWRRIDKPVLVPIPLAKKRLRSRGFNQCELIAASILAKDKGQNFHFAPNVLYKIKDTKNQTSIKDKKQREFNLQGCFIVKDKNVVKSQEIILLDDVTTTGSTFREARKVLLAAGARRVFCVAIAH